jgi:hypothetical protein
VFSAQRSSIGVATALLLIAGCSSSSQPSTFGSGGGSEGGAAGDATAMETGSFGNGGTGTFMCGGMTCTREQYCLFIVSDAGTQMSANCYPYGNCGDCSCVMQMVSAAQCAGDLVTCTPQPPYTVTCVPSSGSMDSGTPGDSGSGD